MTNSGIPRVGRVARVYREGPVLKADFDRVPHQVAKLINQRAYDHVSAEIYEEPPEGINGNGRMLRRVVLMGGDLPHVKSLKEIPLAEKDGDLWRVNGVEIFAIGKWKKKNYTPADLDNIAREFAKHGDVSEFSEGKSLSGGKAQLRLTRVRHAADGTYTVFSEVRTMDREQMIAQLEQMGKDRKVLETMDDLQLQEALKDAAGTHTEPDGDEVNGVEPPDEFAEYEDKDAMGSQIAKMMEGYKKKFGEDYQAVQQEPPAQGGMVQDQPAKEPMAFSEKAIEKLTASITQKILAGMSGAKSEYAAFRETLKRDAITSFVNQQLAEGRIEPAELDRGADGKRPNLIDRLMRRDSVAVLHRFSEGGKTVEQTELDLEFEAIRRRPARKTARVKGAEVGHVSFGEGDDLSRISRFCEENPDKVASIGETKESLLKTYQTASAADRKFLIESLG